MENKEAILEQISLGLSQEPGNLTESFYFDFDKQSFFSIHFADIWHFNEDLEINGDSSTDYSRETLLDLQHWIKKTEMENSRLIQIPQLGLKNNEEKLIKAEEFLTINKIDTSVAKIWYPNTNTPTVGFDLTKEKVTKKWWEFWK